MGLLDILLGQIETLAILMRLIEETFKSNNILITQTSHSQDALFLLLVPKCISSLI